MNWEVRRTTYDNLEKTLQSAPPGWMVFAVVPYGNNGTDFVVIFKQG